MELIEEIIESLSKCSTNLGDCLIRTKVLASRIGQDDLKKWVDLEINGYMLGDPIPSYRIVPATLLGTFSNGFQRMKSFPVPILHLDEKHQKPLRTMYITQSVAALEDFLSKGNETLSKHLPSELCSILSEDLENGFVLETAIISVYDVTLVQVLTTIRSKLLDFLLKLSESTSDIMDLNELKKPEKKEFVQSMFQNAVFGNNTTIIIGDNGTQTTSNVTKTTGNFELLAESLKDAGVSDDDIKNLNRIIENDNFNVERKQFGNKVKEWLNKLSDPAVQLGIGVLTNMITPAIMKYYGM